MTEDHLTIVTVVYDTTAFAQRNLELIERLNPEARPQIIVVDNSLGTLDLDFAREKHLVVRGAPPPQTSSDRGSLHHASGIEAGLRHVATTSLLILDHDFYVTHPQWIRTLSRHIADHRLALFGSPWNPRWSYQYRYFPAIHFFWMDLEQIPLAEVSFLPRIESDWVWRQLTSPSSKVPRFVRGRLKINRYRDTAWQLYRKHFRRRATRRELLVPHFDPTPRVTGLRKRLLEWVLPDCWSFVPKVPGSFTTESFLKERAPEAYRQRWEEFFWQGQPFGIHLRRVGRYRTQSPDPEELSLLDRTLRELTPP